MREDTVELRNSSLRVQQTLEALEVFPAVAGLPTIRVTEMLHQTTFWKLASPCSTIVLIFLHRQSRDREMADLRVELGAAMRKSLGNEISDTTPYTEWLALVGSIVVAVLVCAVLLSNGILT